jgi:hypothetical protein
LDGAATGDGSSAFIPVRLRDRPFKTFLCIFA